MVVWSQTGSPSFCILKRLPLRLQKHCDLKLLGSSSPYPCFHSNSQLEYFCTALSRAIEVLKKPRPQSPSELTLMNSPERCCKRLKISWTMRFI